MYSYGLIGNCQMSALVSLKGSIDWLCLPRPDSPPVFGKILDSQGGAFEIDMLNASEWQQNYIPNTNVLETTIKDQHGSELKITDFCPRFDQYGRTFRPLALFRKIEKIKGNPKIRVICQPVDGWDKNILPPLRGSNHLRYEIRGEHLRLVTNMSLTYLCEGISFALHETLHFGLTWGMGIEEDLFSVSQQFLERTVQYWRMWVQHCSIPSLYQKETIRSALTLKLHCYEDTGAILAALTTSLPEEIGGNRNWDYRFCWLRDSYFVLSAFYNLGHFEEMEGFIKFLSNIAHQYEDELERLHPVYVLDQSLPLPEKEHKNWEGFKGCSQPVRSFNQAAEHVQNDVYGEMILTLAPIYFDERFQHLRNKTHETLLRKLGKLCARSISQPDAGLWELRNGWQEHSFSNLMCWAGLERIQRIRERTGFMKHLDFSLEEACSRAESALQRAVLEGSLRNGPQDPSFDSALLQLPILRFPDKKISYHSVRAIAQELRVGGENPFSSFLYRYRRNDDFGTPQSSFLMCSFWLSQAMAKSATQEGELGEAHLVMRNALSACNHLGLFSEHFSPIDGLQSGNFPQAYSHVGQINAAFALSPSWDQVL